MMAKVNNPRFANSIYQGEVLCEDCPFVGKPRKCLDWMASHRHTETEPGACPTAETYAEACDLAAKAEKEAQG